jgi:hypothetical protein
MESVWSIIIIYIFEIKIIFRNGIKGSAVCIYDISSFNKVFDGPYKYQKRKDSIWEPYNEKIEKIRVKYKILINIVILIKILNKFN